MKIAAERLWGSFMDSRSKEVGNRIRKARKGKKLSQAELSEQLNISPSHMSDIENGKTNIGLDIFMNITEILQVSADWLLRTDTPQTSTILNEEFNDALSGCSPSEIQTILKIVREVKNAIRLAKKDRE